MHIAETDGTIPHPLWRVSLSFDRILDEGMAESLSNVLEEVAVSLFLHNKEATDGSDWSLTLTTYGAPDLDDIYQRVCSVTSIRRDRIHAEKLPEKDWLRHVHENFPPLQAGGFFVYGSHYEGGVPTGLTPLKIDAATAFGSGEHETTRGCLQALESLSKRHVFKNGLDMGCGSGILAIAMAKLWPVMKITAIDIDPESVIVTRRHAAMNGVEDMICTQAGDGYAAALVSQNAPYDVIAANILADPLIKMAPDLSAVLAPRGFAVLSGLLARQEGLVAAAHVAQGLTLADKISVHDWRVLVFQKA